MATQEPVQVSGRFRNALVADYVFLYEEPDALLEEPRGEPAEWTRHLARQLDLGQAYYDADLHSTLMVLVPSIDDALRVWPPPKEADQWLPLVKVAVRDMSGIELHHMILGGPGNWRQGRVPEGNVEKLPAKLRAIVERGLAAQLAKLMAQWTAWDIRDLKTRRNELIAAKSAEVEARGDRSQLRSGPTPPRSVRGCSARLHPSCARDDRGSVSGLPSDLGPRLLHRHDDEVRVEVVHT